MAFDIVRESAAIAEKYKEQKGIEAKAAERRERLDIDHKFWNEAAGEDDADISSDNRKGVIDNNKRIEELERGLKEAAENGALRAANDSRRSELNQPANRLGPGGNKAAPGNFATKSVEEVADAVFNDPQFKSWIEQMSPDGAEPGSAKFGMSPKVNIKALITDAAISGGALATPERSSIFDTALFSRPLALRDLINVQRTTSSSIEFVRQTSHDVQATGVAAATATSGSSGVKPESGFELEVDSTAVKTIAVWAAATRQALSDIPRLRGIIENLLRYDITQELNSQIAAGGGGANLTGILNTTGRGTQSYDATGKPLLTTTRKARTKVRTEGRAIPTGYALNPINWEAIDLLTDGEDRYYFGGPTVIGAPRLWSLPVVEDEDIPEGVGIVADWKLATLWIRQETQVYISDSHMDFFIRNMIAVLAEMRAALAVIRPEAFIEIDLTA